MIMSKASDINSVIIIVKECNYMQAYAHCTILSSYNACTCSLCVDLTEELIKLILDKFNVWHQWRLCWWKSLSDINGTTMQIVISRHCKTGRL